MHKSRSLPRHAPAPSGPSAALGACGAAAWRPGAARPFPPLTFPARLLRCGNRFQILLLIGQDGKYYGMNGGQHFAGMTAHYNEPVDAKTQAPVVESGILRSTHMMEQGVFAN
eukprot:Tamp_19549.p2 GENE.Tamp_19549~~Tamp_19549.p2  ORF type:complete len:113 (-),score=15.11 Tamp_19549:814-1152(-)